VKQKDTEMRPTEILILDGGQATQLEARGHDLGDKLWSARLLLDSPHEITAVHREYLEAGADCITTLSYQATVAGFMAAGVDEDRAKEFLRHSVRIAKAARDEFWSAAQQAAGRRRPLVAASVGPYGAYLANGAEYTGEYGLSKLELMEFHRERWQLLAEECPDVMLCETIPSLEEAEALAELAQQTPALPTWISFSCRDAQHICNGLAIHECAKKLNSCDAIEAIGVNCTAPGFVAGLIKQVRLASDKKIVVFPNSGESFDARTKRWTGEKDASQFASSARLWRDCGATIIGGCCRTTPSHIRAIREGILV
jgi:homocysteine S-methyltransferase